MSSYESQLQQGKVLRHMLHSAESGSLASATARLPGMQGLVDVAQLRELKARLAKASEGGMFVLQLGHTQESENVDSNLVHEHIRNLESIHNYLALVLRTPVLPIDSVPALRGPDVERTLPAQRSIHEPRFQPYTSHAVVDLPFEQAMLRRAAGGEDFFASSAHMLWIDDAHLFPGSGYLQFLRSVLNPIGVRASARLTQEELVRACELLNPAREPGKIVVVTSLGDDLGILRRFIGALRQAHVPVTWMCDPCWARGGQSWNSMDEFMQAVTAEVEHTALLHASEGSVLAGLCLDIEHGTADVQSSAHARSAASMGSAPRLDFLQALHVCSDLASAYGGVP